MVPPETPAIDEMNPLIGICMKLYGMGADTVYLSPAPLYHSAPLSNVSVAMRNGGTVVAWADGATRYATEIQIENLRVPNSNILGEVNKGFAIANDRLTREGLAVLAIGRHHGVLL